MSSMIRRMALLLPVAASLSACHLNLLQWGKHYATVDCTKPQEYQRAVQVPPLKVPSGLDVPNTQGALSIPQLDLAPPPPGRGEPCLDKPPKYKPAPPPKGLAG